MNIDYLKETVSRTDISKKTRDLAEEALKVHEMFGDKPDIRDKNLESLLKRLVASLRADERKKVTGYHSSNFKRSTSLSTSKGDSTGCKSFVNYYMSNVWYLHKIDYYIPKSNIAKYFKRAKDIIETLGSLQKAQKYIDWFLREDRFKKTSFSLDLLISSALLNQYLNEDPRRSREGLSEGFTEKQDASKKSSKGVII